MTRELEKRVWTAPDGLTYEIESSGKPIDEAGSVVVVFRHRSGRAFGVFHHDVPSTEDLPKLFEKAVGHG
ncbi:MAG: hypothetical protein AMS19_07145 [Gemmatimonas sp. SG8_23]|jgi:hypothetical protein|nr:MAG: hypothetical protein AMS19_07145 [Gemmatimonas sp. SG8_23]